MDALIDYVKASVADGCLYWRSDFDGTVSEFTDLPPLAKPHPVAFAALVAMAEHRAVDVGMVTGRPLSFLSPIFPPSVHLDCSYGLERRHRGVVWQHPAVAEAQDKLQSAAAQIVNAIEEVGGRWTFDAREAHETGAVYIELKTSGVALHDAPARAGAKGSSAERVMLEASKQLGTRVGELELHHNNGNFEYNLRLDVGDKRIDKATVIEALEPGGLVFVGDDLGDLPAVRATLARGGLVVAVNQPPDDIRRGSPEELLDTATYVVEGVPAVAAVLKQVAAALTDEDGH